MHTCIYITSALLFFSSFYTSSGRLADSDPSRWTQVELTMFSLGVDQQIVMKLPTSDLMPYSLIQSSFVSFHSVQIKQKIIWISTTKLLNLCGRLYPSFTVQTQTQCWPMGPYLTGWKERTNLQLNRLTLFLLGVDHKIVLKLSASDLRPLTIHWHTPVLFLFQRVQNYADNIQICRLKFYDHSKELGATSRTLELIVRYSIEKIRVDT